MFNLLLKNLDRQTIYTEVLKMSEYLCDEYELYTHFGIISMANQSVVEYLMDLDKDFSVDMDVNVDSREISISFESDDSIFGGLADQQKDKDPIAILTDKFMLSSDNKSVTFMFHVKPHMKMHTPIPTKAFKKIKNTL